jgi:hypothetical protein
VRVTVFLPEFFAHAAHRVHESDTACVQRFQWRISTNVVAEIGRPSSAAGV